MRRWETIRGSVHTITADPADLWEHLPAEPGDLAIELDAFTATGRHVRHYRLIDREALERAAVDLLPATLDRMTRDLDEHGIR